MKRYSTLVSLAVLVVLMGLMWASPAAAVVPKPDGFVTVNLAQGWFADQLAWYTCTTSNNIQYAQAGGLVLAPKLISAIGNGAANMFVVKNFQQGPVFSASPSVLISGYSGLWRVIDVTWLPGVPRRPITNTAPATILNPTGLPSLAEANIVRTNIVLDCPILIIGTLGIAGPTYKIPQMVSFSAFSKTAVLPFFNAFCQDFIHKNVTVKPALITESSNAAIAPLIGANFAPAIALVGAADSMNAWLMDPTVQNPPSQLPVLESCPSAFSWQNTNFAYSPVVKGHLLRRLTAAESSIFNNPTTINALIASGALQQTGTTTLNVQVFNPLQPLR